MRYKLTLPDIGEGVVEAEVLRWFVAGGRRRWWRTSRWSR